MVILKELQSIFMPTCFMPISKEVFDKNRAGDTGGVSGRRRGRGHSATTFLQAKRKKENKGKKRKTFKAETIKRLSPSSKCYCFSHSRASKIQFFFFFGQPCWTTVLASVPWLFHFEIHFGSPEQDKMIKKTCKVLTCLISEKLGEILGLALVFASIDSAKC